MESPPRALHESRGETPHTQYVNKKAPAWGNALNNEVEGLTDEQRAVVEHVKSGHRLTLCCSPAGTGKTHTAGVVASHVSAEDTVLCIAPTWKAISVLRGKLGFLPNVIYYTVQGFVLLEPRPLVELVLVDESSMLTMSHLKHILRAYADDESTRIVFLGDDAQLPCIGRGFPIRDLQSLVERCASRIACVPTAPGSGGRSSCERQQGH